mmetsp:Transcript_22581/g.37740  ORF Transcript_22581/g.37740 Transcript_22581/m.37740 type:complete len:111 (-) Transcript_22581:1019-1351(-)
MSKEFLTFPSLKLSLRFSSFSDLVSTLGRTTDQKMAHCQSPTKAPEPRSFGMKIQIQNWAIASDGLQSLRLTKKSTGLSVEPLSCLTLLLRFGIQDASFSSNQFTSQRHH